MFFGGGVSDDGDGDDFGGFSGIEGDDLREGSEVVGGGRIGFGREGEGDGFGGGFARRALGAGAFLLPGCRCCCCRCCCPLLSVVALAVVGGLLPRYARAACTGLVGETVVFFVVLLWCCVVGVGAEGHP